MQKQDDRTARLAAAVAVCRGLFEGAWAGRYFPYGAAIHGPRQWANDLGFTTLDGRLTPKGERAGKVASQTVPQGTWYTKAEAYAEAGGAVEKEFAF